MNIPIIDNDNNNDNDKDIDNDNDDNNKNDENNDDNVNVIDHDNKGVTDKLFINKPVAIGYNVVKNPDYDNLNLEKDGYIKYFGEDCVEWFINEMLEIESYVKNYLKMNSQLISIQSRKIVIKLLVGYVKKNLI